MPLIGVARCRPSTRCGVTAWEVAVGRGARRCCEPTARPPLARSRLTWRALCGKRVRSSTASHGRSRRTCLRPGTAGIRAYPNRRSPRRAGSCPKSRYRVRRRQVRCRSRGTGPGRYPGAGAGSDSDGRECDGASVHDVHVPLGRHLARPEQHEVAVQPWLELSVVVTQQPGRRVAPNACHHLGLEVVDCDVVHLAAQVTEESHRRHVPRSPQGGRARHHQPVPAAGPGVLEHLHQDPPPAPGPCLLPQPPEHLVHYPGVGERVLGMGEGTARSVSLTSGWPT
jgi:hypothetical protein